MKRPQSRRSFLLRTAALGALPSPWCVTAAEVYPAKPIRLVVPVAPGGGTDTVARLIGEALRGKFGQAVIVDNRPGGAGGAVGAEYVARAAPDGYTLLVAGPGPLATHKFMYPKLGFEPLDFVPISLIAESPNVLLAGTTLPFKTVRDLIAFARVNPGKLNYATGGGGTSPHLAMELLKAQAGLDIQHVPFKGAAAATSGFLQGQADVMFVELSTAMPQIKSGKARALAVGTESRLPSWPDLPTVSETLPGFVTTVWFALAAPPKTPPQVAAKLSGAMAEIMKQPEVVARLQVMNFRPIAGTATDMGKFVRQEADRWGKVIRAASIAVN